MGILNVTPDSFSDGGRFQDSRDAVIRALEMEKEGADLIDVGGESTRPGATPVTAEEELGRILPVLKQLIGQLKIPVSVDTQKAVVAREALWAGASLINDVSGLRDPQMGEVVAQAGVPVILMHMRGTPATMQKDPHYDNLIPEICRELKESIQKAVAAGIANDKVLVDPGLGFSKRLEDNLEILRNLRQIKALGFPVCIGPSRKSFIRHFVGSDPRNLFLGTAAAVVMGVFGGADMVRVHDVAGIRKVCALADAMVRGSHGFSE